MSRRATKHEPFDGLRRTAHATLDPEVEEPVVLVVPELPVVPMLLPVPLVGITGAGGVGAL